MSDWPLLSIVTFLPLAGAAFIFLFAGGDQEVADRNARNVALLTSLVTFAVSLAVWAQFDPANPGFQLEDRVESWLAPGVSYRLGVDGVSVLFVVLTGFLLPICILASWDAIQTRVREYMIAFLVLECTMLGVFTALDFVLFYLFFEGGLIPMFLIIGVWGGPRRIYSTFTILPLF